MQRTRQEMGNGARNGETNARLGVVQFDGRFQQSNLACCAVEVNAVHSEVRVMAYEGRLCAR